MIAVVQRVTEATVRVTVIVNSSDGR